MNEAWFVCRTCVTMMVQLLDVTVFLLSNVKWISTDKVGPLLSNTVMTATLFCYNKTGSSYCKCCWCVEKKICMQLEVKLYQHCREEKTKTVERETATERCQSNLSIVSCLLSALSSYPFPLIRGKTCCPWHLILVLITSPFIQSRESTATQHRFQAGLL